MRKHRQHSPFAGPRCEIEPLAEFRLGLDVLVRYMNRPNLSVDVADCEERRALELSIRTDNLEAMKLLLGHDADLDVVLVGDFNEMSLLDLAMIRSENLGLIAELMHHKRKTQGLQADSALDLCFLAHTLRRLDLTIDSSTSATEPHDAYVVLEQIALCVTNLNRGFGLENEREEIFQVLLKEWVRRKLSTSELDGRRWAHNCLERSMETYLKSYHSRGTWDEMQRWKGTGGDGCT